MLKRLTTAAVGVVGLVVIGLGIASATVWRADDVLVATTSGGAHTLVTDPGVLELGGDPVTVKVSVPGRRHGRPGGRSGHGRRRAGWAPTRTGRSPACRAGTRWRSTTSPRPRPTRDAHGRGADARRAGGRRGHPAPTEGAADAPPPAADPTGSDLWVAEETGTGSAELVWPAQEGRWSLLAVSTGESAPTLSLAWPRVVTTPWLWPCVAVGTLLVLLAAWLLLRDVRRRRAGLDEPEWHPVNTGATPGGGRQRRHRRDPRAHAPSDARGRAVARGAAPVRPGPAGPRTGAAPSPAPAPARRRAVPRPGADGASATASAPRAATSRRALRPPHRGRSR